MKKLQKNWKKISNILDFHWFDISYLIIAIEVIILENKNVHHLLKVIIYIFNKLLEII